MKKCIRTTTARSIINKLLRCRISSNSLSQIVEVASKTHLEELLLVNRIHLELHSNKTWGHKTHLGDKIDNLSSKIHSHNSQLNNTINSNSNKLLNLTRHHIHNNTKPNILLRQKPKTTLITLYSMPISL